MSAHDIWDLLPRLPEEDDSAEDKCGCSGTLHDYCIECGHPLCHDCCIYISGDAFCEDCS